MKFDFIIGNPPYQEENTGENSFSPAVYHLFLSAAYELGCKVEMIHPGRFLFNAGGTPKAWNKEMLSDVHLKLLEYESDGSVVFPGQSIKGGIAITYRDEGMIVPAIGAFIPFEELRQIKEKVVMMDDFVSLSSIIFTQTKFLLENLFSDYPELKTCIGNGGRDKRFRNNAFEKITAFKTELVSVNDICVYGVIKNKRVCRYIDSKYVDMSHPNLNKWKVLIPAANGSGALGEVLSTPLIGKPLIGKPLIGHTQTFLSIGAFDNEDEAVACLKYVKSKFVRVMLGILKVTQSNAPESWQYVPLQDFTVNSDIDWSVSISEIDRQLYEKYGLDASEIDFIETHVTAMD